MDKIKKIFMKYTLMDIYECVIYYELYNFQWVMLS